jgi:dTDP-glucose 4,6-dehydratase
MPFPPLPQQDLEHVLTHTRALWEDLRGQRLFLTGGTGFFGIWLLESLCHANDRLNLSVEAVVLTRNADAFRRKVPHLANHPVIRLHAGDVRTFDFPDGHFSHVIHAATEADAQVMADDPLQVFDVNVEGTRRTLEFARQAGVRRFLFTSSGAVYGRQPTDLTNIPEDFTGGPDPIDMQSTYGIAGEAKRAAESLCVLYARQFGLQSVIARCFAFVGPHLPLDGKFALGNFIRDGVAGGPIRIAGDGTPYRSYLYAADLAIWLWSLLMRGANGRAYNVGSASALSIRELADAVADAVPRRPAVTLAVMPEPGAPPDRYVPEVSRAQAELGLIQRIALGDSLRRTLRWLEAC